MNKKEISLFPLTGKDMRQEYIEFSEVEEFQPLTKNEMVFVWLFAGKTSPYQNVPPKDRIIKCLYAIKDELSGEQIESYSNLNFSPNISAAVERMKKFNPYVRNEAKTLIETIFKNIKKIVAIDVAKVEDIEDKKRYVDLAMGVAKNMPELVRQLEHGYGIREVKQKELVKTNKTIWDQVMESDDE